MGYRSEVVLVLTKEGYSRLKKLLNKSKYREEALDLLLNTDFRMMDTNIEEHLFYWGWIKWYDNEVEAIEEALHQIPISEFSFIRIGEDYNDPVEQLGSRIEDTNIFNVVTVRKIDFTGV